MTVFAGHDLVATRLCKTPGCDGDAEDARGRYAGLCTPHKRARIDADRGQLRDMAARPRLGELSAVAAELTRRARRVERASKKLDDERAELRRVYLRFGVEAGFLNPRA